MRGHQCAADRKAHAQAAILGGVERLKQGLDVVRQTDSAVQHADAHLVLRDESREREVAVFRWIRFHGIARVHDQVEEDLLELHAIRHGRGKVAGGEIRDGDTARNEIAAGEAEQFFETLIHTHRLERDLAAAQHGAQALDDLSGAAVLADDVREDGAKLDEVGRVLRHEALARLRIAEDAAERLAQLVREGTRERAQGGHAGKMRQLLPLQLRLRTSLLLPRDVHRDAEYSRRCVIYGGARAAAARGDPSHRAIGQDDAILRLIRTASLQRVLDRRRTHGAIVGMDASGQGGVIEWVRPARSRRTSVLRPSSRPCRSPRPNPTAPTARSPPPGSCAPR